MKKLLTSLLALATIAPLAFAAVVSPPATPSVAAGGNSFNPVFSADGQKLVFVSHANNLVTNDDLGLWLDVFVRDLVTSNTVLVSVSTSGTGGANADANYPSISANGQFVAFSSRASNLVPGDTNDAVDVFVRDVSAGVTKLASVAAGGNSPGDSSPSSLVPLSGFPMISADGRWVAFQSRATELVPGTVPPGSVNIYARDTWSNITHLVSVDALGNAAAGTATLAAISGDGRHVAFISTATNFVPGITNTGGDLYVRDLLAGTTVCASATVSTQVAGVHTARTAMFSTDGAHLWFSVRSAYGHEGLYDFDLLAAQSRRASIYGFDVLGLSTDGRFILIGSSGGTFRYDSVSNTVLAVGWDSCSCGGTVPSPPAPPRNCSSLGTMSADGRYVSFYMLTDLLPSDCGGKKQAYWRDLDSSTNSAVLLTTNGAALPSDFAVPVISPDGLQVAFQSRENSLAGDDLNGASDIFLRNMMAGTNALLTQATPSKPASTAFAHSFLGPNSVSADGRFIVSTRYDDPSAWRDTNGLLDVFVSDKSLGTSHALSIDTNLYTPLQGGTLPGPGGQFYRENTNSYYAPIISADGTTAVALRPRIPGLGGTELVWARSSNGVFGTGVKVLTRTGNSGADSTGNGSSYAPSVSPNGWDVVFTTASSDLTYENAAPDNSFTTKVVLRRIVDGSMLGTNYLVSVTLGGVSGNNTSTNGILSPDGRWVIFESLASNLTPDGTDGLLNLYARDLWSNVTHQISQAVSVSPVMRFTGGTASFSPDSQRVTYWVQQSSPQSSFVVVHHLLARTNIVTATDMPGSVATTKPSASADGRHVAYRARTASAAEIRVRDRVTGQTDVLDARALLTSFDANPLISGDGRYVVYRAKLPALEFHTNQILVRDRLLGTTLMVSANAGGGAGNASSTKPVLAANGRTVVFQSFASDLAAGDFNDSRDLFVLTLGGVDSEPDGMDDDWEMAYFNTLSRDGTLDYDNDGASDRDEFLAGTDPTNGNSIFRVLTVAPAGGGSTLLLWSGNPTRSYRAEFKDDIAAASWAALTGTISWNGTTASITDPTAGSATNRFYRVLRLP